MSDPNSKPKAHRALDHAKGAVWILAAGMLVMGLALAFGAPKRVAAGAVASGALALLIVQHIGLLLIVASPVGPIAQHLKRRRERGESEDA